MAHRTVLLIDYEPRSIEDTRRPLEEAGYSVEIARDGIAGLEAFHRVHPDLVLVEAMLPKKHGFDVCLEIKTSAAGKDIPVVITTGVYRGRKYRNQALQNFGCDEYLEKPFTDDALLEACNRFIAADIDDHASDPAMPLAADPGDVAARKEPGALDLERMTEDEISSRLDSLLADFGEAVDTAAGPTADDDMSTPEIASGDDALDFVDQTAAAESRKSIFADEAAVGSSMIATADEATTDAPVVTSVDNASVEAGSVCTVDEPTSDARTGPASAVFADAPVATDVLLEAVAVSRDSSVSGSSAASSEVADLIPTIPVAPRSPVRDTAVEVGFDSELRGATKTAQPPTKSSVLTTRSATPGRPRWLWPAVVVVVLAAVGLVGMMWMIGGEPDGGASPVQTREPVTFEPSAAARAGFAEESLADESLAGSTELADVVPGEDPAAVADDQDPSTASRASAAPTPPARHDLAPSVSGRERPPVDSSPTTVTTEPPAQVVPPRPVPAATSKPSITAVAPVVAEGEAVSGSPVKESGSGAAGSSAPMESAATIETSSEGSAEAVVEIGATSAVVPVVTSPTPSSPAVVERELPTTSVRSPSPDRTRRGATPIVSEPPPVRAGDLVPLSEVDTEPVAISKAAPRYHAVARQAKQEGDVVLNVLVDENGAVTEVEVLKGIEGSMLDDAAIRAIRKWTYQPATKDGVPVKVWAMEIISFRL